MNIFKPLLAAVVALPLMTSCLGEGEESQSYTFTYSNNLTYVTDVDTNETYFGAGGSYVIKYDYTNALADVAVSNLVIDSKGTAISFSITGAKLSSTTEGAIRVTSSSYTSTVSNETHTITSLSYTQLYRTLSSLGVQSDATSMSFIIDGRYVVRVVQASTILLGNTIVYDRSSAASMASTSPYYYYELDYKTMTAKVIAGQLTYGDNTNVTLTLEKLPFTISSKGFTIASTEAVTPTISAGTAADNMVTDLTAECTFAPSMALQMTVADTYVINATVNATGASSGSTDANT